MTRRERVTVNLVPSDAEWLRREADDHACSLSVVLQTLIGTARVLADERTEKAARSAARQLSKHCREMARNALEARQMELFSPSYRTVH